MSPVRFVTHVAGRTLRGWADGQFGSADGVVTAGEVQEYVSQALGAAQIRGETPQFGGDGAWVVSKGRERGPDLSALGGVVVVAVLEDLPDEGPDFAALAAQAAEADRQAAALRAQVEVARREKLDSGKASLQAQAAKNWAALGPALATGGDASIKLVQDFVAAYKGKSVTVDEVTEAVAVPEVAKAETWLATKSGASGGGTSGSVSGSDWQSPTLGTMKWIPAGSFMMGSSASESGRGSNETQHKVKLTQGFLLMEHEVTQAEWQAVMGSNPSSARIGRLLTQPPSEWQAVMGSNPSDFSTCGSTCPVEGVSWDDIQVFIQKVSARDHVQYRLPTEAEWEYAARGGQAFVYSGSETLTIVGWYDGNSGNTTHPVCQKQRNAYGLCDMSGNVWEWVSDWYGDYKTSGGTFKADSLEDPQGNVSGSYRVGRGGSWFITPDSARVADRNFYSPSFRSSYLGFRLSRTIP